MCRARSALSAISQIRLIVLSGSSRTMRGMTLEAIITLNAVLGAAVAYGLHHLLALGIRSHKTELHHLVSLPAKEAERIAA